MLSVTLRSFLGVTGCLLTLPFRILNDKKGTNRLYPDQDRGSFGPDLGPNSLQKIYCRRQKSLLAKLKCR